MLLLWLFGIGAGVAHACLAPGLEGPGDRSAEPAARADALIDAAAPEAPAACHGAEHHHEGVPGKTNCQDFCNKASVSIPPLKAALDAVLGAALLSLSTAVIVPVPVPALALVRACVTRRDGARLPPTPFASLRLTL